MRIEKDDYIYSSSRGNSTLKIIAGCLMAMLAISTVVGVVLWMNLDKLQTEIKEKQPDESHKHVSIADEDIGKPGIGERTLTSDDLDFWHMYDEDNKTPEPDYETDVSSDSIQSARKEKKDDEETDEPENEEDLTDEEAENIESDKKTASDRRIKRFGDSVSDNDESVSGNNKTDKKNKKSVSDDSLSENGISGNGISDNSFNAADYGEEEPVLIYNGIPKNNYSSENFRQAGDELQYFRSNRKVSTFGIDVSKYQGNIDWKLVKESGVDFAMIRMGVRGYSTGNVVVDETFKRNVEGALSNGIEVGIYFYSQAVTEMEAVEESNYAITAATAYPITYPIVFYSEAIDNDRARTDDLSADELTGIAKAFCDNVKRFGFKPMVCGSKHQLATRMDPSLLAAYDVWLVDAPILDEDESLMVSEYPYQYTMWQYMSTGKIDGIDGAVDLDICFVDYRYR